ncbi:flagellar hook protein FlgE [Parendozoicomonas haliclonae]|uniref:Flagellar hook protein FlgE n=1 Tax=Parendozoicomonas haliclonae TaxID=1960125 RepID=A0A1X7AND2_9GAMM|nr:flagellar hook protein FlgE [Parendozoicomonas haliclonae]SMA49653.1 Flagellar hook protein FlgE [Parendozoicomonas haliclonae]
MSTLNIGISGLNAASSELNVISNNIANSSTTGYKAKGVQFADVYSATGQGGGVYVSAVSADYAQGAIEYTTSGLDLAISGGGFFMTEDANGNALYTRAGNFKVDKDGMIVNASGQKLQGYPVDGNNNIVNGTLTDLKIDKSDQPAKATANATLSANLDSRSKKPNVSTFDHKDPDSYNFTTSTVVYDQQGTPKTVSAYYVKTENNKWDVHYLEDTQPTPTAVAANPVKIEFDESGKLIGDGKVTLSVSGSTLDKISISMDISKLSQFGTDSSVSASTQDGNMPGSFTGLQVADDGSIFATYTNGDTRLQGMVALATFPNNNGLVDAGNTSWRATSESGAPIVGEPGSGANGTLQSGALELSNVNLTSELVSMVVAQSNYQANAKTISASNEMTQVLLNTI